MGFILGIVWSVIGYVLTQTSLLVWAALMFPNPVERARARVLAKPGLSAFTGLVIWGVTMLLAVALLKEGNPGPLQMMGWLVLSPMLIASIIGLAGISQVIAGRLQERSDRIGRVSGLVGGAFCTTLAFFVPVIGWFVLWPVAAWIGIGAGVHALFVKPKPVAAFPEGVYQTATPPVQAFALPEAQTAHAEPIHAA
jgi:hypothetical protein